MSDTTVSKTSTDDPTGRDRLTWNVLVSWASMAVNIVLGFVMPRLVDEQLGQVSLGIWDFAWALANYITLVNLGVGSNAARYMASFAVDGDVGRLQRIVSSAHVVQVAIGTAVAIAAVCVAATLDQWLPAEMAERNNEAKWVLLLLGLSIAIEMYFDAWRGVLTGIHRWDLHNGINTLHSVLSATTMLSALLAGYGLIGMASMYCASSLVSELVRWRAARRHCPEARIQFALANRDDIRLVSLFGFKNVIAMAGPLLVQQTLSVLITLRLGPAMLAIFSRPTALTRPVEMMVYKFAFVLMPMAGSMQAQGDPAALRRFFIDMCEVGWALAIPGGLFLMLLGPDIIELWMGADYVSREMIVALAGGGMLAAANRPADAVWISNVQVTNGARDNFLEAACELNLHVEERVGEYFCIELPESFEAYEQRLSSSTRKDLRRATRKLLLPDGSNLRACAQESERKDMLETLIAMNTRRWEKSSDGGVFQRKPREAQFYRAFTQRALERGWLRFLQLDVDGKPAAMEIGYRYKDRYYSLQGSYDPDGPPGTGKVVLMQMIKRTVEERVKCFDLLSGDFDYKQRYGAGTTDVSAFFFLRKSLKTLPLRLFKVRPRGRFFDFYTRSSIPESSSSPSSLVTSKQLWTVFFRKQGSTTARQDNPSRKLPQNTDVQHQPMNA